MENSIFKVLLTGNHCMVQNIGFIMHRKYRYEDMRTIMEEGNMGALEGCFSFFVVPLITVNKCMEYANAERHSL